MKLIIQRPAGMGYDEYRRVRKDQTDWLRRRKKSGDLVYRSSELYTEETPKGKVQYIRKWPPAIRCTDKNGEVFYKPMKHINY